MASLTGLTSQSLGTSQSFNWTWFIELVTCGILVLWFIFYLNRLFATIISWAIRAYTWHAFRVYIDIRSLQLSFLGGRLFFKGIRYHGENETVYIHSGHVTWRYWLRSTKQVNLHKNPDEVPQRKKDAEFDSDSGSDISRRVQPDMQLESRLLITVTGLEWFIYNRTPVYDSIVAEAGAKASSSADDAGQSASNAISKAVENKLKKRAAARRRSESTSASTDDKDEEKFNHRVSSSAGVFPPSDEDAESITSDQSQSEADVSPFYSWMLRLFPVGIECSKGAVSLGNEHTKALIVTTFVKAKGYIDAASAGPADIFRQVFDFDIEHPVVQMKPNPDYHLPQLATAERIITGHQSVLKRRPWWKPQLNVTQKRTALIHSLRNLVPFFRTSVASLHTGKDDNYREDSYVSFPDAQPDSHDWHGLDRYMDEDEGDDHQAWTQIEYARFSTILDCPRLHLNFYWDTPGTVVQSSADAATSGLAADLNGNAPPAYGMALDVYGGFVNYGPWSDRLRAEVQNVFFPAAYKTATPKALLQNGETRLSTVMTINVSIREEITLRIPTRENSKDWRWRGRATAVRDAILLRKQEQRRHFRFRRSNKRRLGPDVRPFGWISISAGAHSKIRYVMDMYPGADGYRNTLQMSLKTTKATSSVNHSTLWDCEEQDVSADLSNPLGWNDLHSWRFDVMNKSMNLFLLRDHTFLLLDLINDFTAGLKSDYMTFMPFNYTIGVKFLDLNLLLNANDDNIIDSPCEFDENAFLTLGFARLVGQIDIPMKNFSPSQSVVTFTGDGQDASLSLSVPPWHTLKVFGFDEEMATLKTLHLDGSYNYFSATSPELTDCLVMSIIGGSPKFNLQGYLIRYFMNVKDNYFGDTIHFSTLEEHQARLDRVSRGEEEKKPPPKKQNDLDVILSVRAEAAAALMPSNIYRKDQNLRVDVALIEADMRFTNYYMDLQVTSSPVEVSLETVIDCDGKKRKDTSACQLFIDTITVYGHRLFGAPPTEPTYLCNWDFDVGEVTGEATSDFLRTLVLAVLAFIFTMDDDENALPKSEVAIIPDITFLRARLAAIRIWIVSSDTAFLLELAPTRVELNDWANMHFSKYVKATCPSVLVAAVESTSAYRSRDCQNKVARTYAAFRTSLNLAVLNRKFDFTHQRALQQEHIRYHDSRTHRADWLLHTNLKHKPTRSTNWNRQAPAMPVPMMPLPLSAPPLREADEDDRTEVRSEHRNDHRVSLQRLDTHRNAATPQKRTQHTVKPQNRNTFQEQEKPVDKRTYVATKLQTLSSAYSKPHFQLHEVVPDMTHMPIDLKMNRRPFIATESLDFEEGDFVTSDEAFAHDGIFCDLVDGVHGFCTPELAASVVRFLNEISPLDGETILDDLQMQVVSNIKKLTHQSTGQIDDLAFRLPHSHIRIVNPNALQIGPAAFDQYDLKLADTRATVRITPRKHSKGLQTQILANVSLKDMTLEVTELRSDSQNRKPEAEIVLSDANLWLSLGSEVRARTQVGELDFVMGGSTLDNLAGLLQRSEYAIEQIISNVQIELPQRTQRLLYHLTEKKSLTDPPFMTRPVNVLRAAEEHVRNHDSWKMILRLRHIYRQRLSVNNSSSIDCASNCQCSNAVAARRQISDAFEQWRSWEYSKAEDDVLGQVVFGSSAAPNARIQPTDKEVEFLLGRAAVTLDPGPGQSQLFVQSLDLNFSEKQASARPKAWAFRNHLTIDRVVQAYSGAIGCHLNWHLLDLTQRVIELSQRYTSETPRRPTKNPTELNSEEQQRIVLTVLIGAETASFEVKAPNLILSTGLQQLKSSLISSNTQDQAQDNKTSFVVSTASGRLRLRAPGKSLLGCKITSPTIYVTVEENIALRPKRTIIYTAANCAKLRVHVKEDLLGIMQVVDKLVNHELVVVHQLLEIADKLSATTGTKPPQEPEEDHIIQPHIILLLDDYLLQFDLMTYLRYKITGTVARTSLIPLDRGRYSMQLDIKENEHAFENPAIRERSDKSVLKMPPLSVIMNLDDTKDQIAISIRGTIEKLRLDASAVRACFDAAYKPQTMDYIDEMKNAALTIQNNSTHVLTKSGTASIQPKRKQSRTRSLRYNSHLVLEGIEIVCSAPASRPDETYRVNLNISIATTVLQVSNTTRESRAVVTKPHFDLRMPAIILSLERAAGSRETNFGLMRSGLRLIGKTEKVLDGQEMQNFDFSSTGLQLDLYAETAVLFVDLATFLQARIKSLAAAEDAKRLKPLRRLTMVAPELADDHASMSEDETDDSPLTELLDSTFTVDLNAICLRWLLHDVSGSGSYVEDMAFTISQIELQTTREASARLAIKSTQLQLVPRSANSPFKRTANSALLPEMVFNAAYARSRRTRKFAFKAAGKSLDVRLSSDFIIPASAIQRSLAYASSEVRKLKLSSASSGTTQPSQTQLPKLLGRKRLAHLLVFADFAGAEVTVTPAREIEPQQNSAFGFLKGSKRSRAGRYGQAVQTSSGESASLRAPGIAFQVEYADNGVNDPSLSTEIRVAASSNTLAPTVVPLLLEISASVTNLMEQDNSSNSPKDTPASDDAMTRSNQALQQSADPTAVLGRVKLNAGLLVQKQEFSLTCQPIARVSATAKFEEIMVVVNTVQAKDQERFFSITTTFKHLSASVQHVYSRESTANFAVESIIVSLMNSKHFSGTSGISAILQVSPMRAYLNAKQMQDFMLFREIWYPPELRAAPKEPHASIRNDSSQAAMIQRFQQATTDAVLPWHAVVSIRALTIQVDFGQSIGKSDFAIEKLWASSKKNSDAEQNLCIGFEKIGIESAGRLSGFVELQGFRVRTGIKWPQDSKSTLAPFVQGSVGFEHLRAKAAFDYQPFAVADISTFDFLIYNVRQGQYSDRLVGILDGGKVQVFATTAAAAQSLSIIQAFERLIQEKQESFETSLHELDRYLRRKSVMPVFNERPASKADGKVTKQSTGHSHAPHLHVDVVITIKAIDAGFFMTSFFDETTLKLDAVDVSARFAVGETNAKTHSGLGMTLGQVRVALSSVSRANAKALGEVSVTDVIERATNAKGGTILKVPRLVASMQTWQQARSNTIEYVFRSTFQGKVDIGWNYSRISVIRRMWENHSKALAQKMNKPLQPSAIKITAEPKDGAAGGGQEKITAVVNVPQSKYEYIPLEPPIIDTPQLRDLGEATPSLEWIGLHRDRLPHVTHSVIIVSLLEVAKEVEDTYVRILGSG